MRNTIAKSKILTLINDSQKALSHSEIQAELQGICDRVTTYRVLDRLVEEGYVHKIINMDGVVKFASCKGCVPRHRHHHLHFSCLVCKTVTCLENVEPTIKLPRRYKVESMNLIVSGICPECNRS
jgi:Fur family ferric uptake transcriptional regulator